MQRRDLVRTGLIGAAAAAAGHALAVQDFLHGMKLMTAHAVVAVNAAVQLQYLLTSCHLMQIVNILGNDCFQLSCGF